MSLFPELRGELVEAMERGPRARRTPALLLVPVALVALGLLLIRFDRDERVAQPAPAPWTPQLGDDRRGRATTAVGPIPAEQLAALSVLRRPQSEDDRSPRVEALLKFVGASNRGVHVDGIRLLARHGSVLTVLVPVQQLRHGERSVMRDALCLLTGPYPDVGGAGTHCATFDDLRTRGISSPRPPFGLVPDGVARVTVRVRGGKTLSAPVRGNVYDLSASGASTFAIQPARWFDDRGNVIRRPWR